MQGNMAVEFLASVPDNSADQFVAAVAATSFIGLQNEEARVSPSFDSLVAFDSYLSCFNLSLVTPPDMSVQEVSEYFRFDLFDGRFVRQFCTDLLSDSQHPTRKTIVKDFQDLRQLAFSAREEFEELRAYSDSLPLDLRFRELADHLSEFISQQIQRRLDDPRNKAALLELLADLGAL